MPHTHTHKDALLLFLYTTADSIGPFVIKRKLKNVPKMNECRDIPAKLK
jgi:hypothetical protein